MLSFKFFLLSLPQVKGPTKKNVTPYILFSSEVRKIIAEQNKSCSFGEISRLVGDKVIKDFSARSD